MMNWGKQPAKVNPDAKKKLETFVVNNIDHPISVIYMQSLGRQGTVGRTRVTSLMQQGIGVKLDNLKKVVR